MDVKSIFLNDYIMENFYIEQIPSCEDHEFSNHVFKLNKALHSLN